MALSSTTDKRKIEEAEAAPPAKRQRKTAGKKVRKKAEAAPSSSKPKRINRALKNKIKQVDDFLDQASGSVLERNGDDRAIVSEHALIATLMSMRADWEISDPRMASLLDVQEAIVDEFVRPVGSLQVPANYHVLNLSRSTVFQDGIQLKIKGHGLEDINLLEVQLEMHHRQLEANAAAALADAVLDASSNSEDESEQLAKGIVQKTSAQDANISNEADAETTAEIGKEATVNPDNIDQPTVDDMTKSSIAKTSSENAERFGINKTPPSSPHEHRTAATVPKIANKSIEKAMLVSDETSAPDLSGPLNKTYPARLSEKEICAISVCPAPSKDL